MSETNIFDFLKFKNSNRSYGKPERIEKEIAKMPVTLTSDDGKDFVVYLLVKHYGTKNSSQVHTISRSPYEDIVIDENEIVCTRFDSEEPVRYDMNGQRLNEDSKLELRELD